MTGLRLSSDDSFHFELMRNIGHASYNGADINEVLNAASEIKTSDFESFASVFEKLARRVEERGSQSSASTASGRVSRRDAYFRASTYYRAADFYLHGNPDDPRVTEFWKRQVACFDAAIALLPCPGKRINIQTSHGFFVSAIFYSAPDLQLEGDTRPRPTLIMGNGFDGSQEELLHQGGFAALERGWNVLTYEGPGQPLVRREQGLGFIADWERVVTPIVDYLFANADDLHVDTARIGLWGMSMGGYLCVRAAAFEHRLAAVMAIDGVYDMGDIARMGLPEAARTALNNNDKAGVLAALKNAGKDDKQTENPTVQRWAREHGMWVLFDDAELRHPDPAQRPGQFEYMRKFCSFTLANDLPSRVQCPVFIGNAELDLFFSENQPKQIAAALGDNAHLFIFLEADAAGHHCHAGASRFMCQVVYDWLNQKFDARKA